MKLTKKYIQKADELIKAIVAGQEKFSHREEQLLQKLMSDEYQLWRKQQAEKLNQQAIWEKIEDQINKKEQRKFNIPTWISSAAAIITLIAVATIGYFIYNDIQQANDNFIAPGHAIAYLEINNTDKIALEKKDTLLLYKSTNVKVDSNTITYSNTVEKEAKVEQHTIVVPRGGEFYVVLSDGTKVWLNAESKLSFPTKFTTKKRIVKLEGEGCFKVTKNAKKPFIVQTKQQNIKVLGTQFNVKAYQTDKAIYTTLLEGSVQVNSKNQQQILKPNQQAICNTTNGKLTVKKVNASIYMAWANGKLAFKDETLETILTDLGRWYNIAVFFQHEDLKHLRFSINSKRYENIQPILQQLELTEKVKFDIKKGAIIVTH